MNRLLPVLVGVLLLTLQPAVAQQGIKGQVFWLGGNQMPSPQPETAPTLGIQRDILVYKLTNLREVDQTRAPFYSGIKTELVATVRSRPDGSFKIKLEPGDYSVFIKESEGLFANSLNAAGEINKITVSGRKYTWITITVDYDAVF